ncbi:MAG: hypothetical protein L0Y37_05700 [Bacteroidales bacterium]|nr:hypothetical protein [Bacteroidales bacterium]
MRKSTLLLTIILLTCILQPSHSQWIPYDETEELAQNASHPSPKMRYRLIQSRLLDKNEIWAAVSGQIRGFTEEEYQRLKPFILGQDIPSMQSHIRAGELTCEKLTQWYLYRIFKYENDRDKALNCIIAINPEAVSEARERDRNRSAGDHPIYGMPVLLKDNIGMEGLPTTAGAAALIKNYTPDAFIVERMKEKGAIILGKTNLSEWANYLSSACPNGYSAVGGQTLNPYGRRKFDTGGSSSGSGAAMAAGYAAAAVGTETSGSILSPSSANSVVGLKPTTGLLSRSGIVPLSGTLDTPGPMTTTVTDNAILLSAMCGEDSTDAVTKDNPKNIEYWEGLERSSLKGMRFGVSKSLLSDSLYRLTVEQIIAQGGAAIEFEPERIVLERFSTLLSADMKADLPAYLDRYASEDIEYRTVDQIAAFNRLDSLVRIPYGQTIFDGMTAMEISNEELLLLRSKLHSDAVSYFEKPMTEHQLDAVLSVANRNAGLAAAARYPCLTVPMGYRQSGEPVGITFIARPFDEVKLLRMGYAFEQATKLRQPPSQ